MTQERILVGDQWYVAATSARTEEREHVLKHDESFALFDRFGDVAALGGGDEGLFHEDTRHLSHQLLRIEGARPLYLGSRVKDDNSLLVVELMNPDLGDAGQVRVPKSTLHMLRAKLLWRGACQEHLRLTNHGGDRVETQLSMSFDADFADLFELRGMQRARHGQRLAPQVGADEVIIDLQPAATYNLTITNSTQENAALTGDLDIVATNHAVTIRGGGSSGVNATTVSSTGLNGGASRDRVFHIVSGSNAVAFTRVVIANGRAVDDGIEAEVGLPYGLLDRRHLPLVPDLHRDRACVRR